MKKYKTIVSIIAVMCCMGIFSTAIFAAGFPFHIHVDGHEITLNKTLIKDGNTYVQLRELANKMGADVEWVGFHSAPIPGGNLPEGININQSNVLHKRDISGWFNEKPTIGIEVTSLIKKYNEKRSDQLRYYFKKNDQSGLYVKENSNVQYIPITFYNDQGLTYVTANDFKTKIQPYYVDICLQD